MQQRTLVILGMTGLALAIVYKRRQKFMSSDDPDFREGFVAGWLTPGPFTIVILAGGAWTLLG